MARGLKLRDRDAVLSKEKIIFRVLGYEHPPGGVICDAEYAPSTLFVSKNPKAPRKTFGGEKYYKFYEHEGIEFVKNRFPNYRVKFEPLGKELVGLNKNQISQVRLPKEKLERVFYGERSDELIKALRKALVEIFNRSKLRMDDFGVFGSILHDFYHPKYSDLDFTVYGRKAVLELRGLLKEFYKEGAFIANEFEVMPFKDKWKFKRLSLKEFFAHQREKLIYAVLIDRSFGRRIKVEFEPVRGDDELPRREGKVERIRRAGWASAIGKVVDDSESYFMPSIYRVEVRKVVKGAPAARVDKIVSYVEEFRMQAEEGDKIYVEGNLEEITVNGEKAYQITLTYGERYYEQALKKI